MTNRTASSAAQARIRLATRHDVEEVTDLVNLAYAVEAFFVKGKRIERDEVARKVMAGHFFVAESTSRETDQDRIPGCISYEQFLDHAYFGLLAVSPSARGQRLGRRLIEFVEQRAREAGLLRMTLRTVDLRTELPPWYQRQGYRMVGEEPFEDPRKLRPCKFLLFEKPL